MKRIKKAVFTGVCLALVASCADSDYNFFDPEKHDVMDPTLTLKRDDFKNMYAPKGSTEAIQGGGQPASEPPIPDLAEILAAPKPPKIGETKLVSVAVTDDVPLKDVIIELARLADIDVEVDAGITGGISFRAKDRPFNEVIDRICDLANLRYTMKNNVLRVERDTPYIQIYSLDFLNLERISNNSISISTSVLSGGGDSKTGGGGLNSGSSASITSKQEGDFWKGFESGVKQILAFSEATLTSESTVATQPSLAEAAAAPAASADATAAGAEGIPPTAAGGAIAGGGATGAVTPAAAAVAETNAPRNPSANQASEQKAEGGIVTGNRSFFILNRQAATLTVSATDRQHTMLRRFIKKIEASASAQVLIEAKIVEVKLNEQFQSGINWSKLGNHRFSIPFKFGGVTDPSNVIAFNFSEDSITGSSIDLDTAVQMTEIFGTTRTLSSPRLHATNNQQAVLTFAENQVYFELEIDQQNNSNAGGTQTTLNVTSTVHTVPIGIILSLQPSINMETNEVTLSVRPTLSKVTGAVSDPATAYLLSQLPASAAVGLDNKVPIVEVRELDSILKVKSGQVMVIGGLMEDRNLSNDNGIPGLARVPVVGNFFKGLDRDHDINELVIFIRATIVGSNGNSVAADKLLYDKFTNDPRPLSF